MTTTDNIPFTLPRRGRSSNPNHIRDEDAELVIGAHLEGYFPFEIDDSFGLTSGTAERTLKSWGYKGKLRVPKREYMMYVKLYMEERWSLSAIAAKYNRSPGTVKTYLLLLRDHTFPNGKIQKIRIRHHSRSKKKQKRTFH